jgi:ribosomal protein S18 acetylase RimI-like enzyme
VPAEITIGTSVEVTVAALAQAAGAAWQNAPYDQVETEVLPTAESYADRCRVHDIDLERSVVSRDAAGRVIGFAMLARRGERGWCGDFGVVPEWRGQGIGHRMMEAFLEQARRAGVRRVTLEVWSDNDPARRVYERAGFCAVRELVALRAETANLTGSSGEDVGVEVRRSGPSVLPDWFEQEDAREIPTWERQLPSLLAASNSRILVSPHDGGERAVVVYRLADAFGRIMLVRIGLAADARSSDVGALLRAAATDSPGTYFLAGDEPQGSVAHRILAGLGFRELGHALEMAREL